MEALKQDIVAMGWGKPAAGELAELRDLFISHPTLNYTHVSELMKWCEPRIEPLYIGNWSAPENGHDELHWARRIKSFKAFLRYLSRIIKEWWRGTNEEGWNEGWKWIDEEGEPVEYKYYGLPEPLLSLAFANEPLLLAHYQNHLHNRELYG
jgi:hypothetical protein